MVYLEAVRGPQSDGLFRQVNSIESISLMSCMTVIIIESNLFPGLPNLSAILTMFAFVSFH